MTLPQLISAFFHIDASAPSAPGISECPFPQALGTGLFRIIRPDPDAAIILLDGSFSQNFSWDIHDDTLLHIACYHTIPQTRHCPHTGHPMCPDAFYGQLGLSGHFLTDYPAQVPVQAAHIFLTPAYYDTCLSRRIPNAGSQLRQAISILQNVDYFPELTFIFHQIHDYQCTGAGDILFYESKLNELLARLLQKCFDAPESPSHQIKQADMDAVHMIAEYIRTHTAQDPPLSLLAHMACMSPAKLKYVFKAVFNCSVRDYRLHNRVHVAKELLYHTDLPIAEIAAQLGYQSSGNFSCLFKKYTGFLPKAYRDYARSHHKQTMPPA